MDDHFPPLPVIHESDLLAEIKLSIAQAERGEGRPARDISAESKARYTACFST